MNNLSTHVAKDKKLDKEHYANSLSMSLLIHQPIAS